VISNNKLTSSRAALVAQTLPRPLLQGKELNNTGYS